MDIRQLRYFVGVVEAKSLNKASALLHVAQPALSTQIRNLERELGVKLLHRHARGIVPTTAGERLARHAYQLLRQVERVRSDLTGYAAAPSGGLLMCIARSIPLIVSTAIAERCRRKFPGVHLRIGGSWRQQVQVDRLAADLALTFRPEDDTQLLAEPLVHDELVLACSADDRQTAAEIDLEAVFQHDLILPSPSHYIRRFIENAAQSLGHELRIDCEIDSFELTKELVARRMAKAILPIACVRDDLRGENLRIVRITNPPLQRTLYMLHSARQARSDAVDLVCQEVRAIIFACANRATFGWRRIPMADQVPADAWHDDHTLAPSLDGHATNSVADSVFDLGQHP
ncbi:MAG TPA: LysR family transcriptional regulator [Xanthobacteraceae bacterium]|nr:LysR family transcriptional regulator [Xanthobacteraceae bacterium]